MRWGTGFVLAIAVCAAGPAGAKDDDTDHKFILEFGAAGEWPLTNGPGNFGGTFAAEFEPIENWLELEFGLTTLNTTGHSELSGDLLFKKPFRITPSFEFMVGAGPSVSQTLNGPDRGTAVSAEFALDFMFWPTRDIGWFFEPTYSINPRTGKRAAAFSIGLLLGLALRSTKGWATCAFLSLCWGLSNPTRDLVQEPGIARKFEPLVLVPMPRLVLVGAKVVPSRTRHLDIVHVTFLAVERRFVTRPLQCGT